MVSRSGSEGWTTTMPGDQLFILLTISLYLPGGTVTLALPVLLWKSIREEL
jgi:hypothetical protein